jgi:hypothetical protein
MPTNEVAGLPSTAIRASICSSIAAGIDATRAMISYQVPAMADERYRTCLLNKSPGHTFSNPEPQKGNWYFA